MKITVNCDFHHSVSGKTNPPAVYRTIVIAGIARNCPNLQNLQNLDIQDICTIFAALFTKESFVILIGGLLQPDKMTG